VQLYLQETLTFLSYTGEASVAMSAAQQRRPRQAR
jgi:uncharacterized linocin/CFP29 family protein